MRINRFSGTNDNKSSTSSFFSIPEYFSSVFTGVYTGFQNSATTLDLLCNSGGSGKLKSNWMTRFIAGRLGKKSAHWSENKSRFVTPRLIARGVNRAIEIYCFDSRAPSRRTFTPNYCVQCERAFRLQSHLSMKGQ